MSLPVQRTDHELIQGNHERRIQGLEQSGHDPTSWIYVASAASAWDGGTSYSPGDLVESGSLVYQALTANTGHLPATHPSDWQVLGPPFLNGFSNVGGSRVPMRYRFLRPTDPDLDTYLTSLNPNAIEIQGSVTGGAIGDTIFQLTEPFYLPDGSASWQAITRDKDVHLAACDDSGNFVVMTVLQSGEVVYGFV